MKNSFLFLLFVSACIGLQAQSISPANEPLTENPRGVYRLTTIIGKSGEVIAPYEQYKICTDNVTLHCSVTNSSFMISQNEKQVFNYTGATPKSPTDKSSLIYNSNSKQFALKWWSTYSNHQIFPNNDWCIENYQSGTYSDYARPFFNAIMEPAKKDKKNPFIGKWRLVGMMDELQELKDMYRIPTQQATTIMAFTPSHIVTTEFNNAFGVTRSTVSNATYNGKESVAFNKDVRKAVWLTDDCIALSFTVGYRTDYEIWQREEDGIPIISTIAERFVEKQSK